MMRVECPGCEARVQVDESEENAKIKCPKCGTKFRMSEDEEEEEKPRPAKKSGIVKAGKSRKKKRDDDDDEDDEEKKFPVLPVVGGGIAVLAIVVVLVVVLVGGKSDKKDKDETAANTTPTTPSTQTPPGTTPPVTAPPITTPPITTPPKTNPPKTDPPKGPERELLTGPYAELFYAPVKANLPPMIRAASLKPSAADKEPIVPTFHSLMLARKEAKAPNTPMVVPKTSKLTPEEVKKACAFIKVETNEGGGSGSGFLISSTGNVGLVATNHHVIEAAVGLRYGTSSVKVTVVFNSGSAEERKLKGEVVAYDAVADVAILKVESTLEFPKPLNPYNAPSEKQLSEGIPIHFWGFPLGSLLSTGGKKNPEISLGSGSISSFRRNDSGKLERVQISGTINPGNSGGPVVDADGRLIGLVVSTLKIEFGVGIGFAVPVDDLIGLLEGKLLNTIFVPTGLEDGKAKFLAFAPVMDPLDKIDTVFIRRWAGDGMAPEVVKDPLTGYKPFAMRKDGKANLPGVEEFSLKKFQLDEDQSSGLGIALGELTVPENAGQVLIQVASQTTANPQTGLKLTAASKPVAYTLDVSDIPVGSDARPLSELIAGADSLAGKTIVVRARVAAPPAGRELVQPFVVIDMDGKVPARLKFLVSREHATEFDEVELEHQPLPVRLVCMVGQKGADGMVPVRVVRLDFIGRGRRIVRTIPAPAAADDQLAALNRDPEKFSGKTLDLKVSSVPVSAVGGLKEKEPNFLVIFPNHATPRNLGFTITPSMKEQIDEKLGGERVANMVVKVRMFATVSDKPAEPRMKKAIKVTKIEFLTRDGRVVGSVE